MSRRVAISAALVWFGGMACQAGDPASDRAAVEVRDSAGIQILEVEWASAPLLEVLDSVPEWTVGGEADGASLLLHQVRDAQLLGDGSLIIAEGGSQEVLHVNLSTREVSRWGGSGDGPAEFREIRAVVEGTGSRVGIVDHGRERYVEFDRAGEVVLERPLGPFIQGPLLETALGTGGVIYVAAADHLPDGAGVQRASGRVVRLSGAGGAGEGAGAGAGAGEDVGGNEGTGEGTGAASPTTDTLAIFRGIEFVRTPEYMGHLFFGATGLLAAAEHGLWVADTAEPEVAFWAESGAPARLVRWHRALDRSSESVRRGLMDAFVSAVPAEQRPLFEQRREEFPVRDELPAFGAMLAGEGGSLWIGEYVGFMPDALEMPNPTQEWLVVDPERERAHRVVTPPGVKVLRVGSDFLLALHRDNLGVESVRRYRLGSAGL